MWLQSDLQCILHTNTVSVVWGVTQNNSSSRSFQIFQEVTKQGENLCPIQVCNVSKHLPHNSLSSPNIIKCSTAIMNSFIYYLKLWSFIHQLWVEQIYESHRGAKQKPGCTLKNLHHRRKYQICITVNNLNFEQPPLSISSDSYFTLKTPTV